MARILQIYDILCGFSMSANIKSNNVQFSSEDKRLKFLTDWMKLNGISTTDVNNALQYKSRYFSRILQQDDLKVSQLHKIFNKLGFEMTLSYIGIKSYPRTVLDYKRSNSEETPSRLGFFMQAIMTQDTDVTKVAEALGVPPRSVLYWLSVDDCLYSMIYKLAERYNLIISVKIEPLSTPENN